MPWTICKVTSKTQKNQFSIEYLNNDNDIIKLKVDKEAAINQMAKLGSKTDSMVRKIVLRKHNPTMKRLQYFGLQMLLSIPIWASYDDTLTLVEKYTENLRGKESKMQRTNSKGRKDYLIRMFVPQKSKCIFCLKQTPKYNLLAQDIDYCCEILEKDVPLAWISKSKTYDIFMDWIDFSKCNSSFCSYLEIDSVSQNAQNCRKDEFINLQSCIKLYSQVELVQMQCQKCKEKYQSLQNLIRSMPNILILHMKQFRYTPEGHLVKLDLRLKWQEFLDSSKYTLTNGKLYELFAVVRHSGSSYSGHYTCMAKRKHPFENKKVWVNFDDENADFVRQQSFIEDAYLLLYKKVDMPTSSLVICDDLVKV